MRVYSLSELHSRFGTIAEPPSSASPRVMAANTPPLLSPNQLIPPPTTQLRSFIDHPAGVDRSRDVFACVVAMVVSGYSDSQIIGVLMNPENAVHAHIGDQPNPLRAALRAISRARSEHNLDPNVAFATPAILPPGAAPINDPEMDAHGLVRATPYRFREPSTIPIRAWLYGHSLLRGSLSLISAPGASGKTALTAGLALSLATGRDLLGKPVWGGPKTVWLWNLEDSHEELARLLQATAIHWDISDLDLRDRLFVDSGLDGNELILATMDRNGVSLAKEVIDALVAEIARLAIDVLIIDPFVSAHRVPENDNGSMDAIAKALAKVAVRANCAILLVHHTRKLGGKENTAEDVRGGGSLVNAARSVLTINRMSKDEAKMLGVLEGERRRYFRVYDDKNNRAPPAEHSDWYRLVSVDLGNGFEGRNGDNMPVVVPWVPPTLADHGGLEALSREQVSQIQSSIASNEWRLDPQTKEKWAGHAIAAVLGLDVKCPPEKAHIRKLLSVLTEAGILIVEMRRDKNRQSRPFVVVGILPDIAAAPPLDHAVMQGGAVPINSAPPPPPLKGVGWVVGKAKIATPHQV